MQVQLLQGNDGPDQSFACPGKAEVQFFRMPVVPRLAPRYPLFAARSLVFDHGTLLPDPFLPRFHDTTSKAALPFSCCFIKSFLPGREVEESHLHLIDDNLLM